MALHFTVAKKQRNLFHFDSNFSTTFEPAILELLASKMVTVMKLLVF